MGSTSTVEPAQVRGRRRADDDPKQRRRRSVTVGVTIATMVGLGAWAALDQGVDAQAVCVDASGTRIDDDRCEDDGTSGGGGARWWYVPRGYSVPAVGRPAGVGSVVHPGGRVAKGGAAVEGGVVRGGFGSGIVRAVGG